jgi:hypothetical protein
MSRPRVMQRTTTAALVESWTYPPTIMVTNLTYKVEPLSAFECNTAFENRKCM